MVLIYRPCVLVLREPNQPLELFENLLQLNFLDSFLEQIKELDPKTYFEWRKPSFIIGIS